MKKTLCNINILKMDYLNESSEIKSLNESSEIKILNESNEIKRVVETVVIENDVNKISIEKVLADNIKNWEKGKWLTAC